MAAGSRKPKQGPLVKAAKKDDRIALLRALIVELATKADGASARELPPIARQLVSAAKELESIVGAERLLAEQRSELDRLRKTMPRAKKERSVVDQIAERRARRRAAPARR